MPVDSALIAARRGKPGYLRQPVADRDQIHPTGFAATRANARDLLKWHVDHAAHSQPVLVRLTVFHHGRVLADVEANPQPLVIDCSSFIPSFISKNGNALS